MEVTIIPFITVSNAKEALEFYKKAFNAEIVSVTEMPGTGEVLHAEMKIGGASVYLNDEFCDHGSYSPKKYGGTAVTLHTMVPNADEYFNRAVEAGCTVNMPLEDMFWGARFGNVSDPYGHSWTFSHVLSQVSPEQIQEHLAGAQSA